MTEIRIESTDSPEEILNLLWGHMEFPDNTDRAFEVFVRLELARSQLRNLPNTEPVTISAAWLKALMSGHSSDELRRGSEIRGRNGVTAGLLLLMLHAASTSKRVAFLNDAIELVIQATESKEPLRLPFQPYRNKPEIHRAWKRMAPVAHLWGGLCAIHNVKEQYDALPPRDRVDLIYSNALALQRWALAPADGVKPVIDPQAMVLLSCDVNAPDLRLNLSDSVDRKFAELLSKRKKKQ